MALPGNTEPAGRGGSALSSGSTARELGVAGSGTQSCPVIGQVVSHRCPFRRGPAAGPVSSEVGHSALPTFRRAARWRVPSSTGSFTRTGRLAAPVCYNTLNTLAGNECFFQGDLTCPPGVPPTRQLLSGGSTICGSSRAATNYGTPLSLLHFRSGFRLRCGYQR